MRTIFKLFRMINTVNAVKRGSYGKRVGRRFLRNGIRKFLR